MDGDEPPYDSLAAVLATLEVRSVPKVIGLSLQNNDLRIYEAQQWVATCVQDLVSAIRSSPNLIPPADE